MVNKLDDLFENTYSLLISHLTCFLKIKNLCLEFHVLIQTVMSATSCYDDSMICCICLSVL